MEKNFKREIYSEKEKMEQSFVSTFSYCDGYVTSVRLWWEECIQVHEQRELISALQNNLESFGEKNNVQK